MRARRAAWKDDCGCPTGGGLAGTRLGGRRSRDALDILRDHGAEVFERRGREVLHDPWAARDAYIDVVLGRSTDDFLAEHAAPARPTRALTLLEAQRHALLMYTSCGWFFNDLAGHRDGAGPPVRGARMDLLDEIDEPPEEHFLEVLAAPTATTRRRATAARCGLVTWSRRG